MNPRTLRRRTERVATKLERRIAELEERKQPVPHALRLQVKAARTAALRTGRPAR